jgi:dihydrofolate reductase
MIAHIVAAAKNGVIGVDGELPWSIPEDMKWFRDRTKGRALIMGRKTFESVGHPLPHRLNVVVTRDKNYQPKAPAPKHSPVIVVDTIEKAIAECKKRIADYQNEIFIIGGGEIYHQTVGLVDTIYLTRVHQDFKGDAKYPDPDETKFKLTERIDRDGEVAYSFLTYKRI